MTTSWRCHLRMLATLLSILSLLTIDQTLLNCTVKVQRWWLHEFAGFIMKCQHQSLIAPCFTVLLKTKCDMVYGNATLPLDCNIFWCMKQWSYGFILLDLHCLPVPVYVTFMSASRVFLEPVKRYPVFNWHTVHSTLCQFLISVNCFWFIRFTDHV